MVLVAWELFGREVSSVGDGQGEGELREPGLEENRGLIECCFGGQAEAVVPVSE